MVWPRSFGYARKMSVNKFSATLFFSVPFVFQFFLPMLQRRRNDRDSSFARLALGLSLPAEHLLLL